MPNVAAFTDCGQRPPESVFCTGKIKHVGSAFVDQWRFLKTIVPIDKLEGCKVTMPAPELYHMRYREGQAYPKDVYKTDEKFFAAIAEAYQTELQILYDNGARNIQIDDPNLACSSQFPEIKVAQLTQLQTSVMRRCLRAGPPISSTLDQVMRCWTLISSYTTPVSASDRQTCI